MLFLIAWALDAFLLKLAIAQRTNVSTPGYLSSFRKKSQNKSSHPQQQDYFCVENLLELNNSECCSRFWKIFRKTSLFDTEINVAFYLKIEKNHKSIMKRMMMTSFGFIFRCRYSFSWLDRSSVLLTLWLKVVAKKYFKCSGSIVPFKLIGFTKNVDDKRE